MQLLLLRVGSILSAIGLMRAKRVKRGTGSIWMLKGVPVKLSNYRMGDNEFRNAKRKAQELFHRVLSINQTVEVTGHVWMFPGQAWYYHNEVCTFR